jgi:hypothetical protein
VIAGISTTRKGCSYFFPFSGSTFGSLVAYLAGYERTKAALHFAPDEPLTTIPIRRSLSDRIAETKR